MKLNESISRLRREAGMSQEKLAEEMGVSRQAISKWESGAAMPEIERLEDLARLFDVTMEQLMGLEVPEQKQPPESPEQEPEEADQNPLPWQPENHLPPWRRTKILAWAGIGAGGLLLAMFAATAVWGLGQIRQLSRQCEDLSKRVGDLNQRLYNFESLPPTAFIPAGSGETSLFASCSVNVIQVLPEQKKVELSLQATLADYQPDTKVTFTITGREMEPLQIEVSSDRAPMFSEKIQLPLDDDILVMANITRPDGQTQTQSIGQLCGLKSEYSFRMDAIYKGEARCSGQGVEFEGPCQVDISGGGQLFLQRVEVKIFADGKEAASASMDASGWSDYPLEEGVSQAVGNMTCYPYLEAKVEAKGDIRMEAVLVDESGEELTQTVAVWLKNDKGIFEQQNSQEISIAQTEMP